MSYRHILITLGFIVFAISCPLLSRAWDWPNKAQGQTFPRQQGSTSQQQRPVPTADPVAVNPNVNPITQAAVQAGVLTCTSRINQVSKFLTAHTQNGAFLFVPANAPDQHIFSSSLEVIPPDGSASVYATTSFAPIPGGGCDAVYDTVQFVPETCMNVLQNRFKVNGTPAAIKKDILMLNAGAVRIFLMSADRGCVVIKKEIVE